MPRALLHVQAVESVDQESVPVPHACGCTDESSPVCADCSSGSSESIMATFETICSTCADGTSCEHAGRLSDAVSREAELADQFLHYLRLGCQRDVNLHSLSHHAHGVPDWSVAPQCHVCGPSCMHDAAAADVAAVESTVDPASATVDSAQNSSIENGEDSEIREDDAGTGEDRSAASAAENGEDSCDEDSKTGEDPVYTICHLSHDQLLLLWHQRMGR